MSYRRDDTAPYAGRLHDRLAAQFGKDQIFMDVDRIEPGEDFAEVIERSIGAARVLLVLIGRQWTGVSDDTGARRLDNHDDFVRLEVVAALAREMRVIPVLVGGAIMPRAEDLPEPLQPLVRRHAFEISDTRFHADTDRLIESIERRTGQRSGKRRSRRWLYVACVAGGIVVALTFFALRQPRETDKELTPKALLPPSVTPPKGVPSAADPKSKQGFPGAKPGSSAFKPDARAKADAQAYEAANALRRAGNYEAAISSFGAFVSDFPRSPLAHRAQYWIGDSYYNLRDFNNAIAHQQKLIAAYPDSPSVPDGLFNMGSAFIELGNTAQARKTFLMLIERYPESAAAAKAKNRLAALR